MSLDRICVATRPRPLPLVVWLALLVATLACLPRAVDAYYCDHDLCSPTTEYCCGDNLCCDYASSWWSWYLWVSLLAAVLLLSLVWGCARMFCLDSYRQRRDSFNKVVNKIAEKANVRDSSSKKVSPTTRATGQSH